MSTAPRVAVFDYESGNVHSAVKALAAAGADAVLTRDRAAALEADGLVVPGVGAFQAVRDALSAHGGDEIIGRRLAGGRPVLGICVGMQVLFEHGVERGHDTAGLGEWPGAVTELNAPVLPHMGWNTVEPGADSVLFRGIEQERFYFVHSYAAQSWELDPRRGGERSALGDAVPPGEVGRSGDPAAAELGRKPLTRAVTPPFCAPPPGGLPSVLVPAPGRRPPRSKDPMNDFAQSPSLTLLPAVDVAGGKAVRLTQGEAGTETNYGDPLDAAGEWVSQGASWIHLVDLDAAFGRGSNASILRKVIKQFKNVNVELSGGIRDDASLEAALESGAARINLGTAALENPEWAADVISRYGEAIAVGLDVRGTTLAARGWTKEGGDLWEVLERLEDAGCSRYVVTDVTKDGTLRGPNLELLREVTSRTPKPVVASGGISNLDDIAALRELVPLGVEGAIVGKALYAGAFTLAEALDVAGD